MLVAACGLGFLQQALIHRGAIEALIVAAVLSVLVAAPEFGAVLRRASLPQGAVLAGIAVAMLIGHFGGRVYDTYPFVPWDIYPQVLRGDIRLFDYTALRGDQTAEQLIPGELVPELGKKLTTHIEQLGLALGGSADPARRDDLARRYEQYLQAVARVYNRRHATNPLVAIRIERWTVPVERYRGRASIVREPFRLWTSPGGVP